MEYCLQHYGILGQKWGVRRYQNEDGSLTPAGKKRYSNGDLAYKDFKKAIRRQRGEKLGQSNRWMSGHGIGEKSDRLFQEADKKRQEYENSHQYKQWLKKYDNYYKVSERKLQNGQITVEEFDRGGDEIWKQRPKKNFNDPREAVYVVGKGYVNNYIERGGKDLSIAYIEDIGFNKETAEKIVESIIKRNKTLGGV